ncbi:hypothetical protein ABVV53_05550 [Novosphingobium sp. RD2P27]|uniref:Uncharacterized protein n=1 Tax=Novosphingobium kalidii TaxID=3230299 RepID=A0ABV2CZ95_9SPHN
MTIRFAAANAGTNPAVRAWRCRSVELCAANDNAQERLDQSLLAAALRHFARHGLAAAENAGARAAWARREGDDNSYVHWLALCRQLDRRMADALAARLEAAS